MTGAVVIVGAGHAGVQLALSLRQNGHEGAIALVNDEPGLPYQRPPLSKAALKEAVRPDGLYFRPEAYYREHGIEVLGSERVTAIDLAAHRVELASGGQIPYDHLVLATGARNRRLAVPGAERDGVHYLRTLADAEALRPRLAAAREVVVIGAGFIGLEVAAAATAQGCAVTVVEVGPRVMGRAVTPEISAAFERRHREAGVRFALNAKVERLDGEVGRVSAVVLEDGSLHPADLVVIGIGVLPNAEIAEEAGLAVAGGIVVDEFLATSDPAISAIGDCALFPCRHAGGLPARLESVQNATDQARCVASRLTGRPQAYDSLPWFWSDQGADRLQIAGLTTGRDRTALRGDPDAAGFSVFCYRAGQLIGIESMNRPADHVAGRRLLSAGRNLSPEEAADPGFDLKRASA